MAANPFLFLAILCLSSWVAAPALARGTEHPAAPASLLDEARDKKLGADPGWRALLHYNRDVLFLYRSDINDRRFFLSSRGRTDPDAELETTLSAFFLPAPTDPDEHAQCRFPARYRWLKERLAFPPETPAQACDALTSWYGSVDVASVSLVFASYYLSNAASMYGHTFLKLTARKPQSDLLNYTVNYAAEVRVAGFLYPILGLAGGYRGSYGVMPYYVKVQQYNNMESRDLWEYELRFGKEEIDRLLYHLWEIQHIRKSYFFLNKNCSYELMPLLDAVDPSLNLARRFRFRVIPVDTLSLVAGTPGLVTNIALRPSHHRRTLAEKTALPPAEFQLAEQLADGEKTISADPFQSLPDDRKSPVLDAALDVFKLKTGFFKKASPSRAAREQSLLAARSRLPSSPTAPLPAVDEAPPHEGHGTGRFELGGGAFKRDRFQQFGVRAALHDLAENPSGYLPASQLEMVHLVFRHQDRAKTLSLEKFSLMNFASFPSFGDLSRPLSLKFRLGIEPAYDLEKRPGGVRPFVLGGGVGVAGPIEPGDASRAYLMIEGETAVDGAFRKGYRLGPGVTAGAVLSLRRMFFHASATAWRYGAGDLGNRVFYQADQSFPLPKSRLIRLRYIRDNRHQEGSLSLCQYWSKKP